jgi:hypothetical protein
MTPSIRVNERVHLMVDIPELGLHRGESGVVCSLWFSPVTAFEVEFLARDLNSAVRAVLRESQIEPDEMPPLQADA